MMGNQFVDMLQMFAYNDMGRGALLIAASYVVQWPQYLLGNALKAWSPVILHPKIPQVLMVFGMLMAAGLLAPMSQLLPNLTFTELMLVAAGSAAGAKSVHDTEKIKRLK